MPTITMTMTILKRQSWDDAAGEDGVVEYTSMQDVETASVATKHVDPGKSEGEQQPATRVAAYAAELNAFKQEVMGGEAAAAISLRRYA